MSATPETATKTITLRKALEHIQDKNGKFTSLRFIKRTDGTIRDMVFRTGVKSHLAGGEPAYDFQEHGLIPVFDTQKSEYRSVPKEGITHLKVDGEWFIVKQPDRGSVEGNKPVA